MFLILSLVKAGSDGGKEVSESGDGKVGGSGVVFYICEASNEELVGAFR